MSDSTNATLAASSASAPSILTSTVSTSTPPELSTLSPSEVPTYLNFIYSEYLNLIIQIN
jgi:hypothetical protein